MKDILHPLVKKFMPYAKQRMGFNKPARIFLRDDPQNAQDPLGKTAYYDPNNMSITLYVNGRHPKDVMRSLSHELVHHTQNCNGQFDHVGEMGEGYAQNDEHLREMERQAYEQGNLVFRDWEDSIKGTIYNESLQKGAKKNMSTKDWKNRELPTLLTEKWGFSFKTLTESQDEEVVEEATEDLKEDERALPPECRSGGEEYGSQKCRDLALATMGMFGEGEELEEVAASSGRQSPHADRRGDDERKRPMEEGEKMPDENKDGIPDYAQDGKGAKDLGKAKGVDGDSKDEDDKDDKEEKSDKDLSKVPPQLRKHMKKKMSESQIREIIRKLVKEAMAKKEG